MSQRGRVDQTWQSYERDVARVFEQLDMDARVQEVIVGARATHNVDVAIRHNRTGVEQALDRRVQAMEPPRQERSCGHTRDDHRRRRR